MKRGKAILLSRQSSLAFATAAVSVVEPLYLSSLGFGPAEVGALMGGSLLLGAIANLVLSAAADAYGRKRLLVLTGPVPVIGLIMLYAGIAWGILLVGIGAGGAFSALFAEYAEDPDRDWSTISIFSVASASIGSLLPAVLPMDGVMAAAAALIALSLSPMAAIQERYRGSGRIELKMASLGTVARLSSAAVIGLGAGIVLPMLPLWFKDMYGVQPGQIGIVMAAQSAAMAVAFWLAPSLSRRMGRLMAIVVTQAVGAGIICLVPTSPTFELAASLWVARSVSMNAAQPLYMALVNEMVPEAERARANGTLQLIDMVPRSAGPYFTGYMISLGNLSSPFYATAALYAAATAILWALLRGRSSGRDRRPPQ